MTTERMREAINAMLDQAASLPLKDQTLADLARRLSLKNRSSAHKLVDGLAERNLVIRRRGTIPVFHIACFKYFVWPEGSNQTKSE